MHICDSVADKSVFKEVFKSQSDDVIGQVTYNITAQFCYPPTIYPSPPRFLWQVISKFTQETFMEYFVYITPFRAIEPL